MNERGRKGGHFGLWQRGVLGLNALAITATLGCGSGTPKTPERNSSPVHTEQVGSSELQVLRNFVNEQRFPYVENEVLLWSPNNYDVFAKAYPSQAASLPTTKLDIVRRGLMPRSANELVQSGGNNLNALGQNLAIIPSKQLRQKVVVGDIEAVTVLGKNNTVIPQLRVNFSEQQVEENSPQMIALFFVYGSEQVRMIQEIYTGLDQNLTVKEKVEETKRRMEERAKEAQQRANDAMLKAYILFYALTGFEDSNRTREAAQYLAEHPGISILK